MTKDAQCTLLIRPFPLELKRKLKMAAARQNKTLRDTVINALDTFVHLMKDVDTKGENG